MKALAVTLAYMVYDAACCHLNGDTRLDNTVHHLVSIVGIGAGLAYQRVSDRVATSHMHFVVGRYSVGCRPPAVSWRSVELTN